MDDDTSKRAGDAAGPGSPGRCCGGDSPEVGDPSPSCCGAPAGNVGCSVKSLLQVSVVVAALFVLIHGQVRDANEPGAARVKPATHADPVLKELATKGDIVFALVPNDSEEDSKHITLHISAAMMPLFDRGHDPELVILTQGTPTRTALERQLSIETLPCVVVLVKGGGMQAVSGEITAGILLDAVEKASAGSRHGGRGRRYRGGGHHGPAAE